MEFNKEWVIVAVILPCIAGIFKKEIANTWLAWCIYRNRPFDIDRNPKTADICKMLNMATGQWGTVIIHKYSFWHIKPANRGVTFSHVTKSGGLLERHIGFIEWASIPKAKIEQKIDMDDLALLKKYDLQRQSN